MISAIIGVSKPRDKTFTGLDLDELLTDKKINPRCGLLVINLRTGDIVHWLWLEGVVSELYDVQVLLGVHCATSLGFKTDEIAQLITFETATVKVESKTNNSVIDKNKAQSNDVLAKEHFQLAKQLKKTGKIEEAINNFRQAIQLKPDYAAAYNNLGTILQSQEQLTEAK